MNRVTLIGKINGEPEFRKSTKTNKTFTTLRLITRKEAYVSTTGESYPAKDTIHRVTVFGTTAEKLQKHTPLAEKQICIDGEINYNSLQDQYGNMQTRTDIFANNVELI